MKRPNRKILLVSETPFYGGGEKFVEVFLELMGADELMFAIANHTLHQKILAKVDPADVVRLNMATRISKALSTAKLLGQVRRSYPSRIVLNGLPSILMLFAAVTTGRDTYVVVHTATWNYRRTKLWRLYRYLIERHCGLVFVAGHLERRSPIRTKKGMHVLQNRLLPRTSSSPKFNPRRELKRILFVGRGSQSKGIYEFLEAADQLCDFQFFVVGDVTEPEVADRLVLLRNVTTLGFDETVSSKFGDYDLIVFPSHSEGLPYTVLEAASAGIPIIASDIDAHRELCNIIGPFPLFAVGDASALISRIREIADLPRRSELSLLLRENSIVFNELAGYKNEFEHIFRV